MKYKRKNHSVLLRGLVLTLAFSMTVLCLPFNGFMALANLSEYTDYTYMTIGSVEEEVSTTVTVGATYSIPKAYLGGKDNFIVGRMSEGTILAESVELKSSKITVNYSSTLLGGIENNAAIDKADGIVTVEEGDHYFGKFVADKIGQYTITYSYNYEINGKGYTNSYELKINSELTNASINFVDNDKVIMPSIIDLKLAQQGESYKNLYLATPEIINDNGDEIENVTYVTDAQEILKQGDCVYVSAVGVNGATVAISKDAEKNNALYVAGDVFKQPGAGAGDYVFTYAYYSDNNFVASTKKTVSVKNEYYKKYALKLDLASDWTDNGQTGIEKTLPSAKGITSTDSTPASEEVDVYSTVTVYYKSTNSEKNYELLDKELYNTEETIVNEDGTLADASKFKPLKDGWYTFVYTITDFYGNSVSSSKGVYEYANIKDETAPTPVLYDASIKGEDKYEDASYKFSSRAVPNSVVVYAIGIDDNVSKNDDTNIVLTRKIMTSDTVTKLTISDYNQYNLIFNYRETTNKAFENLRTNNYLIAKETNGIETDKLMLEWLVANNYRIVVDNANYAHIYGIFANENVFAASIDSAEKALEWFKSADAVTKGFAYIDSNETFGATMADNGMGTGTYYVHYIAKDGAGNEKDVSKSIILGSYVDNEIPEIKFPTTLSDLYLPNQTITFDAPTASDNFDTNMLVRTFYRYLDNQGNVITVYDKENSKLSNENLTDLWKTFEAKSTTVNQKLLTETYADYHNDDNDNYVELTESGASSYSINLSEDRKNNENLKNAVNLQIVVYTYDDMGNANIYAETINISNSTDSKAPKFEALTDNGLGFEYNQGAEIELPTLSVLDDAVSYMSYEVNVYFIANDGSREKISTYDFSTEREILSQTGAGRYKVSAGKFVAAYAGEYQVSISVKDSRNKTVTSFLNYNVASRNIVQPPEINVSLKNQTIELDGDANYDASEGISLPTPSVSYDIPNSVTYDKFVKEGAQGAKFVVKGVNENGKATEYSTSHGQQGSFKPTEVGEYSIEYTANLTVYNHEVFEYVEMNEDYEGGYFQFKNESNGSTATVELTNDGKFLVTSDGVKYVFEKDEDGNATKPKVVETGTEIEGTETIFKNVDLNSWFTDFVKYTKKSDAYTIIVNDTIGPKITDHLYPSAISKEEINKDEGYKLKIYGIQATDASGLNTAKSKVVLSWKLANGVTGSHTYTGLVEDTEYDIKSNNGNVLDGTYKVTYTVYDNNNNYTTKEYEIAVGDNLAPTLTFEEDFVETSYEIGTQLKIDISKITADDHGNDFASKEYDIKLVNTSTGKEIGFTNLNGVYVFDEFEDVGTYTLTVEIEDAVGHKTSESFSIEISAKKTNTEMTYKVIGTILIVISVLVLVGVIVYFIVSKVKLDKELKK